MRNISQLKGQIWQNIETQILAKFEEFYDEKFSEVRIHTGAVAEYMNYILGTLAFTIDENIFFAKDCYQPNTYCGQFLLAHELAHIVQHRLRAMCLGSLPSDRSNLLEHEANKTAWGFLTGKNDVQLSPKPNPILCKWDTEGHYYTIYLVALACGLPPDVARQLAFFAQMPDQVVELDALSLGENFAAMAVFGPATVQGSHPIDALNYINNIQGGIHCLGQGGAEAETKRRLEILRKICSDLGRATREEILQFGIGLHSVGDSFAHRKVSDEASLYPPFIGHFLGGKITKLYTKCHDVDDIYQRPALYKKYGDIVYSMISDSYKSGLTRRVSKDGLLAMLADFSKIPDSSSQISGMRQSIASWGGDGSYEPEKEAALRWNDFWRRHPAEVRPEDLRRAMALARDWA